MSYTYAGQYGPEQAIDPKGRPLPNIAFTVYLTNTQTLATLYTDRTKGTQAPNPFHTDGLGNLEFFADPGRYDVTGNGSTETVVLYADPAETPTGFAGVQSTGSTITVTNGSGPTANLDLPTVGSAGAVNFPKSLTLDAYGRTTATTAYSSGAVTTDGTNPMAANLNLNGFKISNLADPTLIQDAATKNYVDTHSNGAGFNWPSPATEGDLLYYHSSTEARIPIGPAGSVLGSNGTDPAWGMGVITTQSGTTYTFVAGDAGTLVESTSGSATTFTIPTNASVAFPVGTQIVCLQGGVGALSVAAAGGVTLNGALSAGRQYGTIVVQQIAANTWYSVAPAAKPMNLVASSGATQTLQLGVFNRYVLSQSCTFTLPPAIAGAEFTAAFIQPSSAGPYTPTITSANYGTAGTPSWSTGNNKKDIVRGTCDDGSTWDVVAAGLGF